MRKQHVFGALCAASLVSVVAAQTVTVTVRNSGGVEHTEVLDPAEDWTHTITSTRGEKVSGTFLDPTCSGMDLKSS